MLPIAAGAVVLVLAGGGAAYAKAHKTVTLDVDGARTSVSTFAGSVDGLLADQHVTVGTRDLVAPSGPLTDGASVVVRHAHQVTVSLGGHHQAVWTTALTADEALADLGRRGGPASLVVSRSGNRADMPLELAVSGPVDVVVDRRTKPVADGSATVAEILTHLGVRLRPADMVSVTRTATGRVQVVVQRVVVKDVTTTSPVPFATRTVKDPSAYTGTSKVTQNGTPGLRTLVERVRTVDGTVASRVTLSDRSTAPVDKVISVGAKARPVARPKAVASSTAAAAAPAPAVSGSAGSLNWAALAACESGGRVGAVSANGLYYGLYQFSVATWHAVGGAGLPSQASAAEQTARAEALYARSGAGQWPVCGKNLFS